MEQAELLYPERVENLSVGDCTFWTMAYRICGWDLPLDWRKYVVLYCHEGFVGNLIRIASGPHQAENKELLSGDSGTWSIECIWIVRMSIFEVVRHDSSHTVCREYRMDGFPIL